jgi:hypothetical protein
MSNRKHLFLAIASALAVLLLGGAALVWPAHRQRVTICHSIADLERKISGLSDQTDAVERLADELEVVRQRMGDDLKLIPETPDSAGLNRILSLPIDARTVRDQTFTAGSPTAAAVGEDFPELAVPLTVDMEATFDSVFALIRIAEQMDRLVRVASVRMAVDRTEDVEETPLLTATIGLEVIYEPPGEEDD